MVWPLAVVAMALAGPLLVVHAADAQQAAQPQQTPRLTPPRYRSGQIPVAPQLALGGGEVLVELTVSRTGTVSALRPLRTTAGFTDFVLSALKTWRFDAATTQRLDDAGVETITSPVVAKVLVAVWFHAPAIMGPTLGEPVLDVAKPSLDAPRVLTSEMPAMPPTIFATSTVVAEATVEREGAASSRVIQSPRDMEGPVLESYRRWTFAPARVGGRIVPARVYGVFVFPLPVVPDDRLAPR